MAEIVLDHPNKLPHTYYIEIGKITYRWALIEYLVHDIVRYYLGLDKKEGRVAFYKTGINEKITLLKTVAEKWIDDTTLAEDAKAIAKKIQTLKQERNDIIHGVWGREPSDLRTFYLLYVNEYKDRILPKAKPTTARDLWQMYDRVDNLYILIKKFYRDAKLPPP